MKIQTTIEGEDIKWFLGVGQGFLSGTDILTPAKAYSYAQERLPYMSVHHELFAITDSAIYRVWKGKRGRWANIERLTKPKP